jgi:hypothetical protein
MARKSRDSGKSKLATVNLTRVDRGHTVRLEARAGEFVSVARLSNDLRNRSESNRYVTARRGTTSEKA